MDKEQVKKAVTEAAHRLSTGNDTYDTAGMDTEILRRHALGESIEFLAHAVHLKIRAVKEGTVGVSVFV